MARVLHHHWQWRRTLCFGRSSDREAGENLPESLQNCGCREPGDPVYRWRMRAAGEDIDLRSSSPHQRRNLGRVSDNDCSCAIGKRERQLRCVGNSGAVWAPTIWGLTLNEGDNAASLAEPSSGTYAVVVPAGGRSFHLDRGVDYRLESTS
jgi:hypothetical protein